MGLMASEDLQKIHKKVKEKRCNLRVKVVLEHLLATQSIKVRKLMLITTPKVPIIQMS